MIHFQAHELSSALYKEDRCENGFFIRRIYVCIHLTQSRYAQNVRRNEDYYEEKQINYYDENRTYNTRWFMNLYKNDEYGRAVDYASRDKIVIDNIQDNELDESIAVAEYYNAEFYKNVYKTMGNTQKLKQMEEQSDMALKRMGSLSILKQKIDSIVNVPDRQTK